MHFPVPVFAADNEGASLCPLVLNEGVHGEGAPDHLDQTVGVSLVLNGQEKAERTKTAKRVGAEVIAGLEQLLATLDADGVKGMVEKHGIARRRPRR
jgi:hypothetical protein